MTSSAQIVPLLVFEAADCLMAVPATEIAQLAKRGRVQFSEGLGSNAPLPDVYENCTRPRFLDLSEYFLGRAADGPWLQWTRGSRSAWLRVRRVIDVVPVAVGLLTPLPAILRARQRSRAFLAVGLRDDDVFLLLDPARLHAERFGEVRLRDERFGETS
jgi:hypothetical protein